MMAYLKKFNRLGLMRRSVFLFFLILIGLSSFPLKSAQALTVIRDSEIETFLGSLKDPLVRASGGHPDAVKLIIVEDPRINAYVTGGQKIFLHTGLLLASENPEEVSGVIAHELGHVAGGHLIRFKQEIENAQIKSLVAGVLGLGVALGGAPDAGMAIMSGASAGLTNNILSHSRAQESAADQAGINFMEKAGFSPIGSVSFMEKLADQELLPRSQQIEYIRTHPLTSNRIAALQNRYDRSPTREKTLSTETYGRFNLIKAKLLAFIDPGLALQTFDRTDTSIISRYARAIAHYRMNEPDIALKLIEQLTTEFPQNPYFYELKGQILRDFARVDQALGAYKQAVALSNGDALMRIDYAHMLLESSYSDQKARKEAKSQLLQAMATEKSDSRIYRLLATIYGQEGDTSQAKLYLAEEALFQNRKEDAEELAKQVKNSEAPGSKKWVKAEDILKHLDTLED